MSNACDVAEEATAGGFELRKPSKMLAASISAGVALGARCCVGAVEAAAATGAAFCGLAVRRRDGGEAAAGDAAAGEAARFGGDFCGVLGGDLDADLLDSFVGGVAVDGEDATSGDCRFAEANDVWLRSLTIGHAVDGCESG